LYLKSKLEEVFPAVVDFITKQGRMKFVRPLYRLGYSSLHDIVQVYDTPQITLMIVHYRDLYACDEEGRKLAVSTFLAHKQFYHSVAANQLAKDLQLN
jgi:leukotriene-A4 hydrolase